MVRRLVITQLLCVLAFIHSATGNQFSFAKKPFAIKQNANKVPKVKATPTMTEVRGGEAVDMLMPLGWGDHNPTGVYYTPLQRWGWCVAYWSVCAVFAFATGKIDYLLNQEWKTPNALYAAHLIMQCPLYLAVWDWSAFSFGREFRIFATVVYPLFHSLDCMMWYVVYDAAKWALNKGLGLIGKEAPSVVQYLVAYIALGAGYITWHRGFLEYRCLPEHHPAPVDQGGRGRKDLYVIGGIIIGFPMFAIYHWFGDMRWGILMRYACDLYFTIRMRLGDPWDKYGNEDKDRNYDYWFPLMKGY